MTSGPEAGRKSSAEPEILTERLTLNSFVSTDAAALFAYRSDPEVCRYQSWTPRTLQEIQLFIEGLQILAFDTPGTWFQLAIRDRESGLLVGDLGVFFLDEDRRQVEVGFTIAPAHQGQGFGTEAVAGLFGYLFGSLNKHRVFASVDPRNHASIALLERVGVRQEAHFRESLWFNGEWVDEIVFAMLESEWKAR